MLRHVLKTVINTRDKVHKVTKDDSRAAMRPTGKMRRTKNTERRANPFAARVYLAVSGNGGLKVKRNTSQCDMKRLTTTPWSAANIASS